LRQDDTSKLRRSKVYLDDHLHGRAELAENDHRICPQNKHSQVTIAPEQVTARRSKQKKQKKKRS
jgi:hypothetical protein